jgi:hypothetical protein
MERKIITETHVAYKPRDPKKYRVGVDFTQ